MFNVTGHWDYWTPFCSLLLILALLILEQIVVCGLYFKSYFAMGRNKNINRKISQKRKSDRLAKISEKRNLIEVLDNHSDTSGDELTFAGISPEVKKILHDESFNQDEKVNMSETSQSCTKVNKIIRKPLCISTCLYGGVRGTTDMLKCCQCMVWVHPECCGDDPNESTDGVYNCKNCRQIYVKVSNLEHEINKLHEVNHELLKLLEKSQDDCRSLRELLNIVIKDSKTSTVSKDSVRIQTDPEPIHKPKPTPAPRRINRTQEYPIHKEPRKPKATIIGDSMVRGAGNIVTKQLRTHKSCVLSISGMDCERACKEIPAAVENHTKQDTIVLQIGSNEVSKTSTNASFKNYQNVIKVVKEHAPESSIVVTAVPSRIQDYADEINERTNSLNSELRKMCSSDKQLRFANCNPNLLSQNYRQDGQHFNFYGISFFANSLSHIISSNFHRAQSNYLK